MVFRKENKVDAFQRQISALRQQLGTEGDPEPAADPSGAYADYHQDDHRATEQAGRPSYGVPESTAYGGYSSGSGGGYGYGGLEEAASSVPAIPTVDAQTSVVAHDTTWKGDLQVGGSIHVHGRVDGSIQARDDVYVAEEAEVDATITAANVAIAGSVRGSIHCSARFEVLPQGRVTGDIHAPSLVVHDGATVNGQFRMTPAESPAAPESATALIRRRAARTGA